jgi:molybdopterin converting factor subunit 1
MPAMKVRLLFFAVLRDITGKSEAEIDVAAGTRASDVWQQLRTEHDALAAYERAPMTAVNEEYVAGDAELHDGDELAFIPPVAGG